MKASVGDTLVVAAAKVDGSARDGRIIEVRHEDGSPPYLVEWSSNGQQCLVFPGPDAIIRAAGHPGDQAALEAKFAGVHHVRSWHVNVDLFESDDRTSAHAVLVSESPQRLEARATARRRPGDPDVPEIGDEIAVARALRQLADHLLEVAGDDIAAIEGHPVFLSGS